MDILDNYHLDRIDKCHFNVLHLIYWLSYLLNKCRDLSGTNRKGVY